MLERYRYVINSMAETGAITPAQAAKYSAKLPKFPDVPINERYGGPKGFLLKMVERELGAAGFASSQISGGGLKITTTFDKDAQDAAVEAAQRVTKQAADASGKKAKNLHAAIASVDVSSGDVLALYGGPDYIKNSRNWATTARPTASTFKAYALAAGLKDGYSLYSTFHGNSFKLPADPIIVRNEYSQQYGDAVTLLRATTDSINTAFVDMVTSMNDGKDKVLKLAEAAGAPKTRGWDAAPRNIPIGTPEVSPLNQASAYATFANDGTHVADHVVKEVRDANGQGRLQGQARGEAGDERRRRRRRDLRAVQRGRERHRSLGADAEPPGRRQDGDQRRHRQGQGHRELVLVRRLHQADLDRGDVRRR